MSENRSDFKDVTDDYDIRNGGERHVRTVDADCWISVLHRMTGFGFMEWETAICFRKSDGTRETNIIAGDHRMALEKMPKEQLMKWYAENIENNKITFHRFFDCLKEASDVCNK